MRVAFLEHSKLRCGGGEREGWQVGRDLYSCIGQSWVWAAPGEGSCGHVLRAREFLQGRALPGRDPA